MPALGIRAGTRALHPPVIPITDAVTASVSLHTQGPTSQSVGGTLKYTARAHNASGRSLPGKTYTATLTSSAFASKSVSGRTITVTLTDIGTTTIKATSGGHDSSTLPVTSVAGTVQSFTVDTDPVTLAVTDDPLNLTIATALNEFDVDLVALGVTVDAVDSSSSDDVGVCTIDGLTITPVGVGATTVHLTLGDATLDVDVTVTA